MVDDQEPRYRLVDAEGNIVGSLFGKPDGTLALQEGTSGANNEATLGTDGTLSVPGVDTESVSTEEIGSERHYAGAYDGTDADARLDAALSAASDGDVVYLENADYTDNRTINNRLTISGTSVAFGDGANIVGNWTIDERTVVERISLDSDGQINLTSTRCKLINTDGVASSEIVVDANQCILYGIVSSNVTFAEGTEDNIIDASTLTDVTDNGTNTVGDIA